MAALNTSGIMQYLYLTAQFYDKSISLEACSRADINYCELMKKKGALEKYQNLCSVTSAVWGEQFVSVMAN